MASLAADGADAAPGPGLARYPRPQFAIARFAGRRLIRSGAVWGLAFGVYVYTNALAFDTIASTSSRRSSLLTAMADNTGLKALLGDTRAITTRAGFIDWRAIGVITLVASVWALLAATKWLRGEESAGRWELFLSGQTTPRRAAANVLVGLAAATLAMYVLTTGLTMIVGASPGIGIGVGQSLFFGAACVAGAGAFAAVGALASQVMATRPRASALAAAVFGASFMLRALGDSAPGAHWLVYLSPLGWIEQLHPLADPQPLWLLPLAALTAVCAGGAILLAGRDLGTSLLADKDTARARTGLLGSPAGLALRLSLGSVAGWLIAMAAAGLLYGTFAKAAGEAFASSGRFRRFAGSLTEVAHLRLQVTGTKLFAGVVFLILMTLLMAYVASAVNRIREEEAEGRLDNLLVRAVSRRRWLAGGAGLVVAVLAVAAMLGGLAFWVGAASQEGGLGLRELVLAAVNSAAPGAVLLGLGVLSFGFTPRLTAVACWGILAWSFLLEMLGSAIRLNHWLMDASLLHHMALAPAVDPDWRIVGTYLAVGAAGALAGGWRFIRRDLASG